MNKRFKVVLKNNKIYHKSFSNPSEAIKEVGNHNIKNLEEFIEPLKFNTSDGIKNKKNKQFLSRKQSNRINR
jgi:hypothetical protein